MQFSLDSNLYGLIDSYLLKMYIYIYIFCNVAISKFLALWLYKSGYR